MKVFGPELFVADLEDDGYVVFDPMQQDKRDPQRAVLWLSREERFERYYKDMVHRFLREVPDASIVGEILDDYFASREPQIQSKHDEFLIKRGFKPGGLTKQPSAIWEPDCLLCLPRGRGWLRLACEICGSLVCLCGRCACDGTMRHGGGNSNGYEVDASRARGKLAPELISSDERIRPSGEREDLLATLAAIVKDYQGGRMPEPITEHIERWVQQFDVSAQVDILRELNHVLARTYFSKQATEKFLHRVITSKKLAGEDPAEFWRRVKFLDIQRGGNSQSDLLVLFSSLLRKELDFGIEDSVPDNKIFVYIDDAVFTGSRVLKDLTSWIYSSAPTRTTLHIVSLLFLAKGQRYAAQKILDASRDAGKEIDVTWWRAMELEDRFDRSDTDVLHPTFIPDDDVVKDYVRKMRYAPRLRRPGSIGTMGLFSSDDSRILLEQQFLKAGVVIRNRCPNLPELQRPLGSSVLDTLGSGAIVVTYRNCPNNAPLALWAGSPWYPLFRRVTNAQATFHREPYRGWPEVEW